MNNLELMFSKHLEHYKKSKNFLAHLPPSSPPFQHKDTLGRFQTQVDSTS